MAMKVSDHIRTNVVGYVAVFFGMTGTAVALPGTNTVDSGDIINGEVKTPDLVTDAVTTGKIRNGNVRPADLAADSVNAGKVADGSLRGTDLLDGSIGLDDLAGESVDSSKVADDSLNGGDVLNRSLTNVDVANNGLGGAEIDEATLGQVPSAVIGGLGRDSVEGTCDPESTVFVTCASVAINVPASGARALLVARIRPQREAGGLERWFCRLGTSTVGAVPASTIPVFAEDNTSFIPLNGITPPLAAGLNSFGIDCTEAAGGDGITYDEAKISAVLISPS